MSSRRMFASKRIDDEIQYSLRQVIPEIHGRVVVAVEDPGATLFAFSAASAFRWPQNLHSGIGNSISRLLILGFVLLPPFQQLLGIPRMMYTRDVIQGPCYAVLLRSIELLERTVLDQIEQRRSSWLAERP